jgi:hypothetical protein
MRRLTGKEGIYTEKNKRRGSVEVAGDRRIVEGRDIHRRCILRKRGWRR